MKSKKSLKVKNNFSEGQEANVRYRVFTECSIPSCESCNIYRQMTENAYISYHALLNKTISENNILFFKKMIIITVSVFASVINFSRLADFKEEQMYLETILSVVSYYLATSDLPGTAALLLGGTFHWCLAFETKRKNLTVVVMTFLQVSVKSLRHYEWFTMVEHLIISCIAMHTMVVLKTHYVTILLYCVVSAYCYYMFKFGIAIEDLLLSSVIVFANHYAKTGDPKHCYVKDILSSIIIWIGLKELRDSIGYTGLGFRLF